MDPPSWGDVILAVAAVLVGLIAALTAQWRLHKTLQNQTEALNLRLERQREDLDLQLEHDQRMREAEGLRSTLDGAAGALAAARDLVWAAFKAARLAHDVYESQDAAAPEGTQAERRRLWHEAWNATQGLVIPDVQLRLRFGDRHEVPIRFREVKRLLGLTLLEISEPTQDLEKATVLWKEKVPKSRRRFVEACLPYVAVAPIVKPPDPPT